MLLQSGAKILAYLNGFKELLLLSQLVLFKRLGSDTTRQILLENLPKLGGS